MPRVLVTGGTGALGRHVVPQLVAAGCTVRVMSRRARRSCNPEVEWAVAELETGRGIDQAVAGVDVVIHAATSPFRRGERVDVLGTQSLLDQVAATRVSHLVYISIVGIDRIPFGYYKRKLEAEKRIERSGVPWSILRATQFHTLIDLMLQPLLWLPVAALPTDYQFQPVDPGEVADRLVACVRAGPSGRIADFGGPEVQSLGTLARAWLDVRGKRRGLFRLPLPGKVAAGFRQGLNTAPQNERGKVTWTEWLKRRYRRERTD